MRTQRVRTGLRRVVLAFCARTPVIRDVFGAPFNRQRGRMKMVHAILARIPFALIIETGTYRAHTAVHLASYGLPFVTIDIDRRYQRLGAKRLVGFGNARAMLGDSVSALATIEPLNPTFFYLDAHWGGLPLQEELLVIRRRWRDWVALIDDCEVPGDAGYGYDDYGDGNAITLGYLNIDPALGVAVFAPSLPSAQETGWRRGCVVLAAGRCVGDIALLPVLRPIR